MGTRLSGPAGKARAGGDGSFGYGDEHGAEPKSSLGLPRGSGRPSLNESVASPDHLHYKLKAASLKAGVKQMISQAWQRHRKDQLAVSVSRKQMHDAMLVEETSTFLNDTFVAQLVMPDLSFAEVFTDTEPVLQQARLRGHRAVEPLSLKTGWDFLLPSHRALALANLRRTKPYMVVIAFPCGPWSPLQQLTAAPALLHKKRKEARALVDFAAEVARLQLENDNAISSLKIWTPPWLGSFVLCKLWLATLESWQFAWISASLVCGRHRAHFLMFRLGQLRQALDTGSGRVS